jgi:hypothetical protein
LEVRNDQVIPHPLDQRFPHPVLRQQKDPLRPPRDGGDMARRTFQVTDVVEILAHW